MNVYSDKNAYKINGEEVPDQGSFEGSYPLNIFTTLCDDYSRTCTPTELKREYKKLGIVNFSENKNVTMDL